MTDQNAENVRELAQRIAEHLTEDQHLSGDIAVTSVSVRINQKGGVLATANLRISRYLSPNRHDAI